MGCEIVAWRFLAHFPERTALDYCLYEIPEFREASPLATPAIQQQSHHQRLGSRSGPGPEDDEGELAPLLSRITNTSNNESYFNPASLPTGSSDRRTELLQSLSRLTKSSEDASAAAASDPSAAFEGLNALEIAAIAEAKRFLSQYVVQKIITGIWNGNIVYWDALSLHATKQPRFYSPQNADPFSRLRVPKYKKCWEVVFFGVFLFLYYTVLIKARKDNLSVVEGALWFWFVAFLFEELSEWGDAGSFIYTADIWNFFDMIVILIGFVFIIMSKCSLTH